ncbi:MAG: hypothetical protein P4L93_08950 [Coriobacteriia bacterium]|nr:hypothetical protein [Coriobacteriia bacterium]
MTEETSTRQSKNANLPRNLWWIVLGVIAALLILGVVVALYFTAQPSYLSRYPAYQRSYSTMQTSSHKGMTCAQCHVDSSNAVGYRIGLVADFYVGLFSKSDSPVFTKLGVPTREACLRCHAYDWSMDAARTSKVPHPAHLRVITETRDCMTCHRWTGHEETYMQQHQRMPFSTVCASFACHVGFKQANDCKNCHHQLQQSLGVWKQDHPKVVQVVGPNACLEKCHTAEQCRTCHTTGKLPVFANTIDASTVTAIEAAHVKSNWLTQHGTFALVDQSKCMTCHVTLQECKDCHANRPAFHGTDNTAWIGTGHEKLAGDPRRCFACHQASQCNNCHQQFGAKVKTFVETTVTP